MDYSELYKKYLFLLDENNKLKSEILKLKTQINIPDQQKDIFSINNTKNFSDQITSQDNSTEEDFKTINKISGNKDKIELLCLSSEEGKIFTPNDGRINQVNLDILQFVQISGNREYALNQK